MCQVGDPGHDDGAGDGEGEETKNIGHIVVRSVPRRHEELGQVPASPDDAEHDGGPERRNALLQDGQGEAPPSHFLLDGAADEENDPLDEGADHHGRTDEGRGARLLAGQRGRSDHNGRGYRDESQGVGHRWNAPPLERGGPGAQRTGRQTSHDE